MVSNISILSLQLCIQRVEDVEERIEVCVHIPLH
jgi:hypothetical protein